jgi:hypothetical protein
MKGTSNLLLFIFFSQIPRFNNKIMIFTFPIYPTYSFSTTKIEFHNPDYKTLVQPIKKEFRVSFPLIG